MRIGPIGCPEM